MSADRGDISSTEARHPRSVDLDLLTSRQIVELMNVEDARVAAAVGAEVGHIAAAIDQIVERIQRGGRLVYVGAGTSGRLGLLEALECPPTFGTRPEQVIAVVAGGDAARDGAVQDVEDDEDGGARALRAITVNGSDAVVAISASGRTPFVLGAVRMARQVDALVVTVSASSGGPLDALADVGVTLSIGPEVLAGSTRLRAGTGQKMVLNMISTGVFVRLGKTYSNLMVDLETTNSKLRRRAVRIIEEVLSIDAAAAEARLGDANGDVKVALVAGLAEVSPAEARRRLAVAHGSVRRAAVHTL